MVWRCTVPTFQLKVVQNHFILPCSEWHVSTLRHSIARLLLLFCYFHGKCLDEHSILYFHLFRTLLPGNAMSLSRRQIKLIFSVFQIKGESSPPTFVDASLDIIILTVSRESSIVIYLPYRFLSPISFIN